MHEVSVLNRGLEDMTINRSQDELDEEEQEKLAAQAEEDERLLLAGKTPTHTKNSTAEEQKPTVLTSLFSRNRTTANEDKNGSNNSSRQNSTDSTSSSGSTTAAQVAAAAAQQQANKPTLQQKYTMGSENNNMRRFKILILGDSGVGKSSLILRWVEDRYMATLTGTVGVNFKSKKVQINGEGIQVQVWDTAGQQQFHKITTSYYRGANGIMVVYDVSDPESMTNVEYWIKNIKKHASESVRVVLVGNKTDLRDQDIVNNLESEAASKEDNNKAANSEAADDNDHYHDDDDYNNLQNNPLRCTDYASGKKIADKFDIPYFETSALDSSGTDHAFINIARFCVGVEDGDSSLLVVPPDLNGDAKPSMMSRMLGRGGKPKAAASAPEKSPIRYTTKETPVNEAPANDTTKPSRKKCVQS
jgi:small GTP-binding protein